jgi:glycosyltransferase involved in cell wall biosynthesis
MSLDWPPSISVIVPVRNGQAYLADALGSIATQSCPVHEVIIIEGLSTDDSAGIAHEFARKHARETPENHGSGQVCVRVIEQHGQGLAAARNQGLRAARGTYIAFLDADDIWLPGKLAVQIGWLRTNSTAGIVIGYMRRFSTAGSPLARRFDAAVMSRPAMAFTPGAMLAHRECMNRAGPFDESLKIGCDTDWFARARDVGVPIAVLPEVVLHKRIHNSALSSDTASYRRELVSVVWQSVLRRANR